MQPFDVVKKFILPSDEDITKEHFEKMIMDFEYASDATKCLFANQTVAEAVCGSMIMWYKKYNGDDKEDYKDLINKLMEITKKHKNADWRNKIEKMSGWMDKDGRINP